MTAIPKTIPFLKIHLVLLPASEETMWFCIRETGKGMMSHQQAAKHESTPPSVGIPFYTLLAHTCINKSAVAITICT